MEIQWYVKCASYSTLVQRDSHQSNVFQEHIKITQCEKFQNHVRRQQCACRSWLWRNTTHIQKNNLFIQGPSGKMGCYHCPQTLALASFDRGQCGNQRRGEVTSKRVPSWHSELIGKRIEVNWLYKNDKIWREKVEWCRGNIISIALCGKCRGSHGKKRRLLCNVNFDDGGPSLFEIDIGNWSKCRTPKHWEWRLLLAWRQWMCTCIAISDPYFGWIRFISWKRSRWASQLSVLSSENYN